MVILHGMFGCVAREMDVSVSSSETVMRISRRLCVVPTNEHTHTQKHYERSFVIGCAFRGSSSPELRVGVLNTEWVACSPNAVLLYTVGEKNKSPIQCFQNRIDCLCVDVLCIYVWMLHTCGLTFIIYYSESIISECAWHIMLTNELQCGGNFGVTACKTC